MRSVPSGLLLGISALSSVASAEGSGPPTGQKLRGTVLVWQDAKLFVDPTPGAPSVAIGSFGTSSREEHLGAAVAMRVVADRGAFLEVTPAEVNCGRGQLVAQGVRALHLFVQRADLAPVLATAFSMSYPNGTAVALAAGTPVLPASAHYSRVGLGAFSVALPIAAAKVKYSYPSFTDHPAKPSARTRFAVAADTTVKLGDGLMVLPRSSLRATKVDRRHETALVQVRAGCVDLSLLAPSQRVVVAERQPAPLGAALGTFGALLRLSRERYFVRKGTALRNEAGRVIGVADEETEVQKPSGKVACFDAPVRLEPRRAQLDAPDPLDAGDLQAAPATLRLCAPAAGLRRVVAEAAP